MITVSMLLGILVGAIVGIGLFLVISIIVCTWGE